MMFDDVVVVDELTVGGMARIMRWMRRVLWVCILLIMFSRQGMSALHRLIVARLGSRGNQMRTAVRTV